MACNCETYECLEVYLTPCAATVTLPLLATENGVWKMVFEFNGATIRRDVVVSNGVAITVPNVFNENYIHELKFFTNNNTVFNDTCYQFKIMPTIFTEPAVVPENNIVHLTIKMGNPENETNNENGYDIIEEINSDSISHPLLKGYKECAVRLGVLNSQPTADGHQYYSIDPDNGNNGRIDFPLSNNFDTNIYVTLIK